MDRIDPKKEYVQRLVCDSLRTAEVVRGVLVLAAVSGGRDSVVLLHTLKELQEEMGYRLETVHVNHGMRDTADRDEAFVRDLCLQWKIPCHVCHGDVPGRILETKESPEEAARKLRYALIKQTALKISADAVAVAHHADDQAETMLLGISRGSEGLLRGMRDDVLDERGRIIRPLLNATGEQIAAYANAFELTWMEDETNRDETVARNRIRRRILPYLKQELDPKLVVHLGSLAKKMQEDEDALSEIARKRMAELTAKRTAGVHLNDEVMSEPVAVRRRIFEEILRSLEVKRSTGLLKQLEDLFDRQSGKKVTLTENAEAVRDRTGILFREDAQIMRDVIALSVPGTTRTPWGIFEVSELGSCTDPVTRGNCQWIPETCGALYVRLGRAGEKIAPIGLNGRKLVSDVFSDKGILLAERQEHPVIADDEGPVWIPGVCVDRKLMTAKGETAYFIVFTRKEL